MNNLSFRSVCDKDLAIRKKWLDNENLKKSIGFEGENTLEANKKWLITCQKADKEFFIILLNERPIGLVGLKNISINKQDAEIFIMIAEQEFRQKGFGEASLRYIMDFAIKMNLTAAYLEVNKENIPAINLYKKIGFVETGSDNEELSFRKILKRQDDRL